MGLMIQRRSLIGLSKIKSLRDAPYWIERLVCLIMRKNGGSSGQRVPWRKDGSQGNRCDLLVRKDSSSGRLPSLIPEQWYVQQRGSEVMMPERLLTGLLKTKGWGRKTDTNRR